ncbi:MAG: EamA family transporter [Magnetococcales bacterium]|nr:EamA family transporter [Magnetococcales bacterium]NGZ27068.1 EamA family transporter [Magnetococcales bacterium]
MEWLIFAFLTALLDASKDMLGKKLSRQVDPSLLALAFFWPAIPFLLPILWLDHPVTTPLFWGAACGSALLNALATTFYVHAITHSHISLVIPMIALSPVVLLFTSPLMIGEVPSPAGSFGVVLMALGTWWLKREEAHRGWLAPWHALFNHRGARLMLGVAIIWGVSANLDKIAVQESTPLYYSLMVVLIQTLILTLPVWSKRQQMVTLLYNHAPYLLLLGAVMAAMIYANMAAISLGMVAYVIAIKRSSVLFGVVIGHLVFGEEGFRHRLTGAALMVAGMVMVVLQG